jgi:gamma-glutamyltranspeptidase/glutathione hydrolase
LLEAAQKVGDYGPMSFDPSRSADTASGSSGGGSSAAADEADEAVAAATNAYDSSTRASYDSGWAEGVDYTVQDLQALADAQNIAFADRNKYMGDADFVDLPMPNSGIDGFPSDGGLFSKEYARERWAEHGGETQEEVPWGIPPDWDGALGPGMLEDDHGTTHFVVVDKDKNVVSWTTTIESNMGSSVVVPGRGFPLNNEMTDFDATAEDSEGNPNANAPQGGKMPRRTALIPEERRLLGGKRPRSSMAPTVVLKDGEPFMAIGCPGGSSIIGAVSNALLGRLVHELPLQTAVDLPRIISKNPNNAIEEPMCVQWPEVCAEFRSLYSTHTSVSGPGTLVQAVEILPEGGMLSAADTKRIDSGACGAI